MTDSYLKDQLAPKFAITTDADKALITSALAADNMDKVYKDLTYIGAILYDKADTALKELYIRSISAIASYSETARGAAVDDLIALTSATRTNDLILEKFQGKATTEKAKVNDIFANATAASTATQNFTAEQLARLTSLSNLSSTTSKTALKSAVSAHANTNFSTLTTSVNGTDGNPAKARDTSTGGYSRSI